MERRPSGVTFSAVVLGLISLFIFFVGVVYVIVAVLFARSPGLALSTANQPAPPVHFMVAMLGFFALATLACAAWGFSTMSGLIRMKNWARISIIIIGGCLAAFGLLEVFGCIMMQLMMPTILSAQNAGQANHVATDPNMLRGVFLFIAVLNAGIAAIGILWIVYFALRSTREAFKRVALNASLYTTSTGRVQFNPSTPITDFSVAQPLEPTQPVQPLPSELEFPLIETAPSIPERPISMTIVAVLLFFAALSLVFCSMLLYPLFYFGIQVSGWSAHLLALLQAALYALGGYGLLKRMHFGWVLAVGMQCLGVLNILTMLSPPVRERWMAYTREMSHSMTPTVPNAGTLPAQMMQEKMMSWMLVPSLALGIVFAGIVLLLLWRARWWYKSSE